MFSLLTGDLTEFRGERVKGRGGGCTTSDYTRGLWATTGGQVCFTDSDESFKGCGAKTETTTTVGVRIVHDFRKSERRMHWIDAGHGRVEDETRGCTASVAGAVTRRIFRGERTLPIALLELHTSFHLQQLNVVVGGTLTGSSAGIVRMQVGIGLRGTDIVDRVDGVMTTGDGLRHSHIVGVHGGSRDRAHGGDRITS